MERRFTSGSSAATCTIERAASSDGDRISGYGAVFFRAGDPATEFELWRGAVERILPGAFDAVLKQDVRGLFNHSPDNILGRTAAGTMTLTTDGRGLRYTIRLPSSPLGKTIAEAVGRGDITGSSFSFDLAEDGGEEWRVEDGLSVRYIRRVGRLFDCGPVSFPAYSGTTAALSSDVAPARQSFDRWSGLAGGADAEARRRRRVRADWVARELKSGPIR